MKTLATFRLAALTCLVAVQGLAAPPAWAQEATDAQRAAYRRPETIPFPADNPNTPETAPLGNMQNIDTPQTRAKNQSCAS